MTGTPVFIKTKYGDEILEAISYHTCTSFWKHTFNIRSSVLTGRIILSVLSAGICMLWNSRLVLQEFMFLILSRVSCRVIRWSISVISLLYSSSVSSFIKFYFLIYHFLCSGLVFVSCICIVSLPGAIWVLINFVQWLRTVYHGLYEICGQ